MRYGYAAEFQGIQMETSDGLTAFLLDSLPSTYRLCIIFCYYDELTTKEIADVFGCSEGDVVRILQDAFDYMRTTYLNKIGPDANMESFEALVSKASLREYMVNELEKIPQHRVDRVLKKALETLHQD